MVEMDLSKYSHARAIQMQLPNQRVDGLEAEFHQEQVKTCGIQPEGIFIPTRVQGRSRRDLSAGTFNAGGALIPTNIGEPIELLRNLSVCDRLGITNLRNLRGVVAIPRQTSAATAVSVAEAGPVAISNLTLDQVVLSPHRIGAATQYTRQLVAQAGIDVGRFIQDDIEKVIALKKDYLILQGTGANDEPLGVMNTPGIGSVQFGGAASWSSVLSFEQSLAAANADFGNMGYITTPAVRTRWKAISKIAASTFPIFLWELGPNGGEVVNGHPAFASNQILGNLVAFGSWQQVIWAEWGTSLLVNPYSLDTNAEVRVTISVYADVAIRHPQSFCWSADPGNQ